MVEVGDGGFGTEFEQLSYLIHADRPEHVRAAGGPWAGVARVVEHASAVLEDGQVKLAEVWRSPAGQLYLAKMAEVARAMREVSVVARHNGQVMDAAAEALDAKQKDFAVLSTAPIPQEARERYARAIVASLDESYQQAAADFRPVPMVRGDIGQDPSGTDGSSYTASRQDAAFGGASAPSGGSAGTAPRRLPPWVPTQPATAAGPGHTSEPGAGSDGGPQLQGTAGTSVVDGGFMSGGSVPGVAPGGGPSTAPGAQAPPAVAGPLPFGPDRAGAGRVGVPPRPAGPRPPAGQQAWPPAGRPTPGAPHPRDAAGRPTPAARPGASQSGAMLGGVPAGAAGGTGRSGWQGYRRPAEPFPTSQQTAVAPVIGATPAEEPELVSTDYDDEHGNRITIRRLA